MTATIPNPFFPITFSVWNGDTEITTEVQAPSLTEAINALKNSYEAQGYTINVTKVGGVC